MDPRRNSFSKFRGRQVEILNRAGVLHFDIKVYKMTDLKEILKNDFEKYYGELLMGAKNQENALLGGGDKI